jgi:hypothetical protein
MPVSSINKYALRVIIMTPSYVPYGKGIPDKPFGLSGMTIEQIPVILANARI